MRALENRNLTRMAAGAALALATAGAALEAATAELSLERVMLSAGGVGYFEYEARVEGDAVLELSVRLDQVDDVLKSIVVYDDRGVAGAIRLAGRDPVDQIFRDLPFGPDALSSPVALLNALPGVGIRAVGQREVEGRLVRVVPETRTVADGGGTLTRHRVSVMTAAGLQSFLLEETDAVRFTDPALAAQVDGALAAVSAHRTRDRRTLEIVSNGQGARAVRVGYVVASPLWKSSYRLSLGEQAQARLQGWAVLENMSGQDWDGVELTLVSGNPVTFRQALYAAYYAERPEIPVEVLGRVLPAPDTGAIGRGAEPGRPGASRAARSPGKRAERKTLESAPMLAMADGATAEELQAAPPPEPSPGQARLLAAVSTEAAASVSFRIPRPVTVGSGQSLLVPIIDRDVPADRVSLYQPATHPRHPLAAVRLRNDGESGLPPGVLTVYESGAGGNAFVGDAQLGPLPAGEERLVSYALDRKTVIDREDGSTETLTSGRAIGGALELTRVERTRSVFRIKAPARESRTVLLEYPRIPDATLEQPDVGEVTLTESAYRIEQRIAAGETLERTVVLSRPRLQRVILTNQAADRLLAYASAPSLDPALRKALDDMAGLRGEMDAVQREIANLERAGEQIRVEQERIRNNLARIPRDSDLYRRYLAKLDGQEDRLERLDDLSERARTRLEQARAALAEAIGRLAP